MLIIPGECADQSINPIVCKGYWRERNIRGYEVVILLDRVAVLKERIGYEWRLNQSVFGQDPFDVQLHSPSSLLVLLNSSRHRHLGLHSRPSQSNFSSDLCLDPRSPERTFRGCPGNSHLGLNSGSSECRLNCNLLLDSGPSKCTLSGNTRNSNFSLDP